MPSIREQNRAALDALRIRRDALLDAILDLEQTVAAPATDRVAKWAADVSRAMERLNVVLEHHIADTENAGGFFDDLLQEEPRLSRAVEHLRADHDTLSASVEDLSAQLRAAGADTDVDALRAGLLDLIRALLVHRHRGADLVYEAYNVDLSVGD